MSTIFGRIIQGDLPSEKVFENERILAIKDVHPQAPIHLLIMPKKEYSSIQTLPKSELPILVEIFAIAQQLAVQFGVADNYRLLTNNGRQAGQSVFHLHFHLIGGRELGPMA